MASLSSIAQALGGEVSGRQILAPGPGHSARDRSLCVRLSAGAPEGFLVHSHCGDDPLQCRDHVRARLGWERPARFGARRDAPIRHAPAGPDPDELARIERARQIWGQARDPRGTVVEIYLQSRGLALPDEVAGGALRFHPTCPWRDEASGRTIFVPAMIALFRSIATGELTGIHRTRLTPAGRKADCDRRMLGKVSGAAIMLSGPAGESLTVGEGVETCLSAMQLGLGATWAMGSVGAIAALPVIAGVRRLTLLAETDDGGASAKAIDAIGSRYAATGRDVLVVTPTAGGDLNDVIRRRAA